MPVTPSTNSPDSIIGTVGDDSLVGWLAGNAAGDFGPATDNDTVSGGDGNDMVSGGGGADSLSGDAGNDMLYGGTGKDMLYGGAGNDVLNGGAGLDKLYGGDGDDALSGGVTSKGTLFDGGAGINTLTLDLRDSAIKVDFSIADPLVASGRATTFLLQGISKIDFMGGRLADKVTGGALDDTLSGGLGQDKLYGGDGNDRISGGGWNDTLMGGRGDDILNGGQFNDRVFGGAGGDRVDGGTGRDTLFGGAGDDRLYGGLNGENRAENSADEMTGGGGADTFHFTFRTTYLNTVADKITDYTIGEDKIVLHLLGLSGPAPDSHLSVDDFVLGLVAADASDRVIYDAATGRIWYDADGNGTAAMQLFAQVTPELHITAADFHIV